MVGEAKEVEILLGDEAEGFNVGFGDKCYENGPIEFFLLTCEGFEQILQRGIEKADEGEAVEDFFDCGEEFFAEEVRGEETYYGYESDGNDKAETGNGDSEDAAEDFVEAGEDVNYRENGKRNRRENQKTL